MTETEFRITFSEMMQYYQTIEFDLNRICAALNNEEPEDWYRQFKDHTSDTLNKLIGQLENCKDKRDKEYINNRKINKLKKIKDRRNYWAHQGFYPDDGDLFVTDKETGEKTVRERSYVNLIKKDHGDARDMAKDIENIYMSLAEDLDLEGKAIRILLETMFRDIK